MFYLKSLKPNNCISDDWNYTRWGVLIPKEEIELRKLKDLFKNCVLTEGKIEKALRDDSRIFIENEKDREARLNREIKDNSVSNALEEKNKRQYKKKQLDNEIKKFNKEKQAAQETETKEDDLIVAEKEKKLNKKIKESKNGF